MSVFQWLQRRQLGLPAHMGDQSMVMRKIYNSLDCYEVEPSTSEQGGIFNLEFSPNGNVLVAACEKKSILLFDAVTTKQVHKVPNAHLSNVNVIKFLDNRNFATGSDDNTVALWDLRYLNKKVRTLQGHTNWVKNIEYSHKDNLLVTSGFDGCIFTWDINSHTEQGLIYQKVLHISGLMRCRISPDGTKLVICTTGGYIMIIHNLDLTTLPKDLSGFNPIIYRLMQTGHQHIPQAAKYDHVFSKKQKKNRVELVTDFPVGNDAEVILALQIHPHGHSFLSRNISYDEMNEWSCIHDINEEIGDITDQIKEPSAKRRRRDKTGDDNDDRSNVRRYNSDEEDNNDDDSDDNEDDEEENYAADEIHNSNSWLWRINRRERYIRTGASHRTAGHSSNSNNRLNNSTGLNRRSAPASATTASGSATPAAATSARAETFVPDIWAAEVTVEERATRQNRARSSNSVTGYNFVYAISSGVLPQAASRRSALDLRSARNSNSRRQPFSSSFASNSNSASLLRPGSPVPAATASNESSSGIGSVVAEGFGGNGSSTSSIDSPPRMPRLRMRTLISPLQVSRNRENPIIQNPKKLIYYIQESNTGKGFIKEPCFSSDGRIVGSPYEKGVRLLAYDANCSEYLRYQMQKDQPQKLTELKTITGHHADIVLTTKFSPREPLMVSGCRSGKIGWYHTNL